VADYESGTDLVGVVVAIDLGEKDERVWVASDLSPAQRLDRRRSAVLTNAHPLINTARRFGGNFLPMHRWRD